MLRFRTLFFFLILAAISSRIIIGELIHPIIYLSIILNTAVTLALLLNKNKLIYTVKDKTAILPFAAFIVFLIVPLQLIYLRLLLLVIFCFLMGKIIKPLDSADSILLWIMGFTTFLFTLILWVYKADPILWYGLQIFAEKISSFVGDITNQNILLNATSSGIQITILFISTGVSILLFSVSSPKSKHCFQNILMQWDTK